MPKAKPNKSSPIFMTTGHPLSEGARKELIEILGFGRVDLLAESFSHQFPGMKALRKEPDAPLLLIRDKYPNRAISKTDFGKILGNIEVALGLYVDGAEHIDNIPRPSDYVNTFEIIRKRAIPLLQSVSGMSAYFRGQVDSEGGNIHEIEQAIGSLFDISGKIIKKFEGAQSKGAKKNTALTQVILRLRRIFRANYHGPRPGRSRQGAISYRSVEEKQELDFVKTALLDARIIPKGMKNLSQLFLDPRCAVLAERAEVIERPAKKVYRTREREEKRNKR